MGFRRLERNTGRNQSTGNRTMTWLILDHGYRRRSPFSPGSLICDLYWSFLNLLTAVLQIFVVGWRLLKLRMAAPRIYGAGSTLSRPHMVPTLISGAALSWSRCLWPCWRNT